MRDGGGRVEIPFLERELTDERVVGGTPSLASAVTPLG